MAISTTTGTGEKSVVVIGAGLVGLCSALWLQRTGHHVTVFDRRPPAPGVPYDHAASYGNACTVATQAGMPVATPGIAFRVPGMLLDPEGPLAIRWSYLPRLAPWLIRFLKASTTAEVERIAAVLTTLLMRADAGYAPLIADAGLSDLIRREGCLYLYKTEKQFGAALDELEFRKRHGVRMDILDAPQVRELEPSLAPLYHRGVLFADAYTFSSPHRVALGLAQAIRARGGDFVQGEVERVEPRTDGVAVQAGADQRIVDRVVVAAGAWSGNITRQLGDRIPLDTERGYHVLYPKAATLLRRPVCYPEHGFYMTPMEDGLRVAGTVELAGLEAPLNPRRTQRIVRVARTLLPQLDEPTSEWLGFRPSMPDSLPVIGPSPRDSRVIYAFGHGHIGLTLAGITGKLVADLVGGRRPDVDLAPLSANRFG